MEFRQIGGTSLVSTRLQKHRNGISRWHCLRWFETGLHYRNWSLATSMRLQGILRKREGAHSQGGKWKFSQTLWTGAGYVTWVLSDQVSHGSTKELMGVKSERGLTKPCPHLHGEYGFKKPNSFTLHVGRRTTLHFHCTFSWNHWNRSSGRFLDSRPCGWRTQSEKK